MLTVGLSASRLAAAAKFPPSRAVLQSLTTESGSGAAAAGTAKTSTATRITIGRESFRIWVSFGCCPAWATLSWGSRHRRREPGVHTVARWRCRDEAGGFYERLGCVDQVRGAMFWLRRKRLV